MGLEAYVASDGAFAAVKANGCVVTWGDEFYGGDSTLIQSMLRSDVLQVTGAAYAFTAVKKDGSVVTWGDTESGGDNSAVPECLRA